MMGSPLGSSCPRMAYTCRVANAAPSGRKCTISYKCRCQTPSSHAIGSSEKRASNKYGQGHEYHSNQGPHGKPMARDSSGAESQCGRGAHTKKTWGTVYAQKHAGNIRYHVQLGNGAGVRDTSIESYISSHCVGLHPACGPSIRVPFALSALAQNVACPWSLRLRLHRRRRGVSLRCILKVDLGSIQIQKVLCTSHLPRPISVR